MTNMIAKSWRSFWHTMTSNDRHADHDSHYRNGQHVPLPQSRHAPLGTSATSALDSRTDLNSPYGQDIEAQHGFVNSNGIKSPGSPFSAAARPTVQHQSSGAVDSKMADVSSGEIQMQNFSDGLPPPPPVSHSWKRIDRWMEDNYEELWENLCEGATQNDVNELEHQLDCTLPTEVRESIAIHDGQERGGRPTGALFGLMLLDCEEIVQEWQQWRTVNEAYFGESARYEIPQAPIKAFAGSSTSAAHIPQAQSANNSKWRDELLAKQDSQPDKAVQKVYAHPAWIPLARDWGGNNICVDLAPGPAGRWGQVIIMGRDYDCKYVISRSWSAFLATVADDMATDKWWIDDDSRELKLREFRQQGVEPAYIEILRWRADQKYGRKKPRKGPLRINSNVAGGAHVNGFSPYASPTSEDRGRSPNRSGKAPLNQSPRVTLSSPLARVTEEESTSRKASSEAAAAASGESKPEKLVDIQTPVSATPSFDAERRGSLPFPKSRLGNVENANDASPNAQGGARSSNEMTEGGAEELKNVEI